MQTTVPPAVDLKHLHDEDLENYVRGRLGARHAATAEAHLLECEHCRVRVGLFVGLHLRLQFTGTPKPAKQHKRSEPRFVTGDEAVIRELHPLCFENHRARITDVSTHGLGIQVMKPVLPGTIVQVRIGTAVELGEVRHCHPQGEHGYRIGLRLSR
jgi:hypothetical protein